MSTKFLVIGGTGMIGSKFINYFIKKNQDFQYTYLNNHLPFAGGYKLDITKKNDVIDCIDKVQPNIVIHTTALVNVDLCQINNELAYSINVKGTENIINACKKNNSKIIYISTSAIFDGKKEQYFEDDQPNPISYYGTTKYLSEEKIRNSDLDYLILRTDQPYCWIEKWQHMNYVIRVLQSSQSSKIHKEISDWYNTPTYVPNFVEATARLVGKNKNGIFHIVGSDYISRYDWSLIICNIFGLEKKNIIPFNSDELKFPAKRANANLSNQKVIEEIGIKMLGVEEGLKQMLNDSSTYS